MKYLIAASVSWFIFVLIIKGINLNILISMAIHRNIQFVLDKAIIDLRNNIEIINIMNGLFM